MNNAHHYYGLHEDLGVNLNELGCLMLKTDSPLRSDGLNAISEFAYTANDIDKFWWITGVATDWHVTVRYGFMDNVRQRHVDTVLEGLQMPEELTLSGIEVFPSSVPTEDYGCVVARVDDRSLRKINQQLSVLPNVNTYPEYKPHITIGYFDVAKAIEVAEMAERLISTTVATLGYDYGHVLTQ